MHLLYIHLYVNVNIQIIIVKAESSLSQRTPKISCCISGLSCYKSVCISCASELNGCDSRRLHQSSNIAYSNLMPWVLILPFSMLLMPYFYLSRKDSVFPDLNQIKMTTSQQDWSFSVFWDFAYDYQFKLHKFYKMNINESQMEKTLKWELLPQCRFEWG